MIKSIEASCITTDIYEIHAFYKSIKNNVEARNAVQLHRPNWESIYYRVESEFSYFTRENSFVCHCGSFDCGGDHGECLCGSFDCNKEH